MILLLLVTQHNTAKPRCIAPSAQNCSNHIVVSKENHVYQVRMDLPSYLTLDNYAYGITSGAHAYAQNYLLGP